jgi:hypothetical protein
MSLERRVERLESALGVAEEPQRYALISEHDPYLGRRRVQIATAADWTWRDVDPDHDLAGVLVVGVIGPGMSYFDLLGGHTPASGRGQGVRATASRRRP